MLLRQKWIISNRNQIYNRKDFFIFTSDDFTFNWETDFEKLIRKNWKISSKMACEIENLFDFEEDFETTNELPISILKDIEVELCNNLLHSAAESADQTDGPLGFIQNIVDNVRSEFENFIESGDKKTFLRILTKIFALLLSVKAGNSEKIINITKFAISTVVKKRSEQN